MERNKFIYAKLLKQGLTHSDTLQVCFLIAILIVITDTIVNASPLVYNLLCEWELRNVSKTKKTLEFNNTTNVEILALT